MNLVPGHELSVRQQVLGWALATSGAGEGHESILARAHAYLDFLLEPLLPERVKAARELAEASADCEAGGQTLKLH